MINHSNDIGMPISRKERKLVLKASSFVCSCSLQRKDLNGDSRAVWSGAPVHDSRTALSEDLARNVNSGRGLKMERFFQHDSGSKVVLEPNAAAQAPPTNGRGQRCIAPLRSLWSRLLAMHIGFSKVANRTEGLQILKNRFTTPAPRDYMVNVQFYAKSERGTSAAGATGKTIALKHAPTKPKRRLPAGCTA